MTGCCEHWRSTPAALLLGVMLLAAVTALPAQTRVELPLTASDPVRGTTVSVPGARPLHVVFFASWCPPCVAELGPLAELEARWSDRGYRLVIVGVNTRQTAERLGRMASERQPPGTLLFDADGTLQKAFGVTDLPLHVLVGRDGTVRYRAAGVDDRLRAEVERLARESGE